MKYLLLLLFITTPALSDVQYLNLEAKRLPFQRDYYYPNTNHWGHELSLNFKATIGKAWLESDITGQSRKGRFRNIWWDYTLGYELNKYFDVVWDHKSQHSLDIQLDDKYPVRDSLGFRINFLK